MHRLNNCYLLHLLHRDFWKFVANHLFEYIIIKSIVCEDMMYWGCWKSLRLDLHSKQAKPAICVIFCCNSSRIIYWMSSEKIVLCLSFYAKMAKWQIVCNRSSRDKSIHHMNCSQLIHLSVGQIFTFFNKKSWTHIGLDLSDIR